MQKWETHLHTKNGSICGQVPPKKVAKIYAEAGYNGLVLTNHFNISNFTNYFKGRRTTWVKRYLKDFYDLKKYGEERGMTILLGMEMCLFGDERRPDKNDYSELLVYGITPEQLDAYGIDLMYRSQADFYALCNQNGWLCGQSHPFRDGVKQLDFSLMHLLEAYNGHTRHVNHNDDAALTAERYNLIPIGGSDFHIEYDFGCGMLFPDDVAIKTEADFVNALRSRRGQIITRETSTITPPFKSM